MKMDGVKIVVRSTSRPSCQIEVIEISPRLIADLTDRTVTYDIQNTLAGRDLITPIGSASANTASITFTNDNAYFDNLNVNTPFYNILDDGILFTIDLIYDTFQVVRQATMLSDTWSNSGLDSATVSLLDFAKIFQETQCPDMLLKGYRSVNLIWRILDAVGFPNVEIFEDQTNLSDVVEYFWCGKESTVWQVLADLAKSYQMAMFFDEFGTLKVMSRDYIYNNTRASNWTFQGDSSPDGLSDIYQWDRTETLNYNKVTVKYQATNDFNVSGSRQQIFWQPAADYGIGAINIVKPIAIGDTKITVDAHAGVNTAPGSGGGATLPFWSGQLQIGNYIVDWTGEGYIVAGVERQISSDADWAVAVEDNNGIPPTFSGTVFLKTPTTFAISDQISYLNSVYKVYKTTDGGTSGLYSQAVTPNATASALTVTNPGLSYATRIQVVRPFGFNLDRIGAKFQITTRTGGVGITIFPQGPSDTEGYYFTIFNGDDAAIGGAQAAVRAYKYQNNGTPIVLANTAPLRPPLIITNSWHYMEVIVAPITGGWAFNLYMDGRFVGKFHDTSSPYPRTNTAGFYIVGPCTANFDKFYAVDYPSDARKIPKILQDYYPDDAYWYATYHVANDPKVSKGDQAFAVYERVQKRSGIGFWVDEFNAWKYLVARQIITETVRFDKFPAKNAIIYSSNNLAVSITNFQYTPMGATFTIKNNTDAYQPLNGTGIETAVTNAQSNQSFFIFGDTVFQMSQQSIVNQETTGIDIDSIFNKHRRETSIEFDFIWLQTRVAALRLAEWCKKRFGIGTETYTMEVFGNPLLQLGDVVLVNYVERGVTTSNFRGVISSIQNSWSQGLSTKLEVRKIVNV